MAEIYVGDIGVVVGIETEMDLTNATLVYMSVKKPNGVIVQWPVSLSDGALPNSMLTYSTRLGDLDQFGIYKIQPYLATPTFTGYGTTVLLPVNQLFT